MLCYRLRIIATSFALVLAASAQEQPHRLNLVIVEGDGAINNIKLRTSRETIVQVEDENHKPVGAAVVAFLLPDSGPGGSFVTGSKSATVVADANGRAVMPRVQLNNNAGRYQIRVHASSGGLEANASIAQSSIAGAAGISTGAIIGIVVGVAAAGAVAAVVASKGGNSGTPSTTPTPPVTPAGTIGTGSGSLGPPH